MPGPNSIKPQAILKELGPRLDLKIPEFVQELSKQAEKMKSFKQVKLWTVVGLVKTVVWVHVLGDGILYFTYLQCQEERNQ